MVRKGRAQPAPLATIPDNEANHGETDEAEAVIDILQLINNIEAEMEERIATIQSAAEDAIISLRNELKTKIIKLPKQTRDMPLKQFQEKYPDDFKTGALQEIRQRYAAMAAAAQQAIPATAAKGGKTGKKRPAAEPMTVLQTVKTRRTASALMPSWGGATAATAAAPPLTSTRRTNRGTSLAAEPYSQTQQEDKQQTAPSEFQQQQQQQQPFSAAVGGMETSNKSINSFNGRPLETPLPFAGASMPLPVTMLTQKRGGRTKAAAAPDAAVVTTADGMQWALGRDGISAIPETHRAEVADMLSAQFNFLAAALGKTVFDRPGGKGGKSSRR